MYKRVGRTKGEWILGAGVPKMTTLARTGTENGAPSTCMAVDPTKPAGEVIFGNVGHETELASLPKAASYIFPRVQKRGELGPIVLF